MLEIKVNIDGVKREVARLHRIAGGLVDLSPFLKKAGVALVESSQKNFLVGGRPKWLPLSASTVEIRAKSKKSFRTHRRGLNKGRVTEKTFNKLIAGAKTLRDTGRLMASIGVPGKGGVYRLEPDSITIGTAVKYAEPQQRGATTKGFIKGKKIPPRPFLLVQPDDETNVIRLAREFADGVIDRNKN